MMISGPRAGYKPLAPVRLLQCAPLKIVVPGPDNIRRRNLDTYLQSHGIEVAAMLEMDAMIATLEFVARSDWVTILPSVISVNDIGRGELIVNPITPELHSDFVVIQPTRRTLSTQARMFLERIETEVRKSTNGGTPRSSRARCAADQTDAGAPGCLSGWARAKASFSAQVAAMRATVGNGARSTLKKVAPAT
jgi:hypothetical protein